MNEFAYVPSVPYPERNLAQSGRLTLDQLLSHHNITIDPASYKFCQYGLDIMKKSPDPTHTISHIERMFGYLDRFISENSLPVDYDVLLISIVHHDVWRVMNYQPSMINAYSLLTNERRYAGGFTADEMKKRGFDDDRIKKVEYCIQKHGEPAKAERASTEAKLLWDFDCLDAMSPLRVSETKDAFTSYNTPGVLKKLSVKSVATVSKLQSYPLYYATNQSILRDMLARH